MKKRLKFYLFIFVIVYTHTAISQTLPMVDFFKKEELTLEDAVLAYYKGLYPQEVERLTWLKDVDKYCYATDTSYIIKEAKKCKLDIELTLSFFQSMDSTINYLPYVEHITSHVLVYQFNGSIVWVNYRSKVIETSIKLPENAENIAVHYDKKLVAYTLDNNLFLASIFNNQLAITNFENKNIVSGQAIHRFEFGISKGIFWTKDGGKLAFYQKDETDVADYPLLDINQTPGALTSIKYPMAGQKSEYGKVGVYSVLSNTVVYLQATGDKEDYLTNVSWGPKNENIYVFQVNRGQNTMQLNAYNAQTGEYKSTLLEEKNEKWVEPEFPLYFNPKKENECIVISEKDGFQEPYLLNINTKELIKLANLGFPITSVIGYTFDGKFFDFMATGTDGRNNLGYRLDVATKQIQLLTTKGGTHEVKISSSGEYATDAYSDFKTPGKTDVVTINKQDRVNILTAENPLSNHKMGTSSLITLQSEDNFNLYGRVILPADFDENKKYPVLVYVYGGPHAQLVTNSWLTGASLWMYWMANQGYVVFSMDGRGSANRGFAFESIIHRQLGQVEMKDQMVGVNYLKGLNYVDTNRLAVHGWSFGGFMTTSLLLNYPNVFTTGVAGGPVMDWKWYEIMYGERYMDMPQENPEGYALTSTINKVKNLDDKLLTIHGTIDDVVVMQHNLAFIQACVKNGVQVDFFPYPMHKHNVGGRDRVHLMTKVLNYILENNK